MLKLIRNEKGAALPMVVIIFMILMMLGIAFLRTSESDAQQTSWQNNRVQAHYLGRSGVEHGLNRLINKLETEEYTDTVQQLIIDLNSVYSDTYTLDDTGTYTIHFDEGIYTRQIRITSVGNATGRMNAEKTVSYMVDLIPPYGFEIAGIWSNNAGVLNHGVNPASPESPQSLLGLAVLLDSESNNALTIKSAANQQGYYQASLMAFMDFQGESLEVQNNAQSMTFDSEVILFPGEVMFPNNHTNPVVLSVSDNVLKQRTDYPVRIDRWAPEFLRFLDAEDHYDEEAELADGIVGFENESRYETFIEQTYERTVSPAFKDDVSYGVVRLAKGIVRKHGSNKTSIFSASGSNVEEGYFYFPDGTDLTKDGGDGESLGRLDLIPIPDNDPLVEKLNSLTRLTLSDRPGLWNNR